MCLFLSSQMESHFSRAPGNNYQQLVATFIINCAHRQYSALSPVFGQLSHWQHIPFWALYLGITASAPFVTINDGNTSCSSCATSTTCIPSINIPSLRIFLHYIGVIVYTLFNLLRLMLYLQYYPGLSSQWMRRRQVGQHYQHIRIIISDNRV